MVSDSPFEIYELTHLPPQLYSVEPLGKWQTLCGQVGPPGHILGTRYSCASQHWVAGGPGGHLVNLVLRSRSLGVDVVQHRGTAAHYSDVSSVLVPLPLVGSAEQASQGRDVLEQQRAGAAIEEPIYLGCAV